jgi:hypothetical protein
MNMALGDIKISEKYIWNPLSFGFFDALFISIIGAFIHPALFVAPFVYWAVVFAIRTYIAFFRDDLQLPD